MSRLSHGLFVRRGISDPETDPFWQYVKNFYPTHSKDSPDAPVFLDFGFKLFPINIFFSTISPDSQPLPELENYFYQFHKVERGRGTIQPDLQSQIRKSLTLLVQKESSAHALRFAQIAEDAKLAGASAIVLKNCRLLFIKGPLSVQTFAQNCEISRLMLPDSRDMSAQGLQLDDCEIESLSHAFFEDTSTRLTLHNLRIGYLHSDATEINLNRVRVNLISLSRISSATLNFRNVSLEYSWNSIVGQIWRPAADIAAGRFWKLCRRMQAYGAAHFGAPAADPANGSPVNSVTGIRSLRNTLEKLRADNAILISPGDYERLYHYLDSRESWPKRLLYSFVGAYYNIWRPLFVGVGAAILNYILIPYFGAPAGKNPILFVANPKALLEDVLLPDFSLSLDVSVGRTLLGVGIFVVEILFGYSLFAFGLAIRRRFGFPKES
jgi:hypothetical protein